MMMRLFLWLSILWLAPVVTAVTVNDAKFKKSIAVGVTLPHEAQSDPAVLACLTRFRREEWRCCIALLLTGAGCIFVPGFGLNFTLWSVWLILLCVLPNVVYARSNTALRRLKQARGWRKDGGAQTVQIDLAAIPDYRWLSPWLFALPLAVSLLPLLWDRTQLPALLTSSGCIVLFWLCYRFCYRRKSERADENIQLTKVLSQVRQHSWGRLWLVSAWVMAALNFALSFAARVPWLGTTGLLLLMAVHIAVLLRTELRLRRLQEKLTAGAPTGAAVDEDDLWLWGQFYYNPNDRHLIVNARTGINTTVNLARPAGRAIMAFSALCLLGCLAVGPAFTAAEKAPMTVSATQTEITAENGRRAYPVRRSEITGVQLLDALPDDLVRTNGTSMEHIARGRFYSHTYGKLTLCLDPAQPPFLLLETDGMSYLFGSRERGQAQAVYEFLSGGNETLPAASKPTD